MEQLRQQLETIDQRGYKAYKTLEGDFQFPDYLLRIDHVQGDPFADPSRCRLFINSDTVKIPDSLFSNRCRTVALEDFIGRSFARAIHSKVKGKRGSGRSGEVTIASYGQEVLERNAVLVRDGNIEVRIQISLPADGRSVNAHQALVMLFEEIPLVVTTALAPLQQGLPQVEKHINSVEDQQALRNQLFAHGLSAFIADGAILPRLSGIDERPLPDAVPFQTPPSLAIELQTPHLGSVRGLGIPHGVTLIVGGGFHGKSTLLHAIERGVYDHLPGDGREQVVSDPTAVKIRAEDRRAITGIDISPFINNLPQQRDTHQFSTQDASGSTSQAANIMEALAAGSKTLLIDEDTSATNFMIRDERMQALVSKECEPITPLLHRIHDLHQQCATSVIMVMGGSGDYFGVADRVIMMNNYIAEDVTIDAHQLAHDVIPKDAQFPSLQVNNPRHLLAKSINPRYRNKRERVQAIDRRLLRYGSNEIDLSAIEQLADNGQLTAIGYLISHLYKKLSNDSEQPVDIIEALSALLQDVENRGLDTLPPFISGTLAMPRLFELAATINRLRTLKLI
ncbi:MAG: ABC-ATPase domain-containing protein [Gammaproteobacteria bacterium]|nr:ABC-ATPase domain-containing protein [Gammaproteobacteria bacterium]